MIEYIGYTFLTIGALFILFSALAIVRFPDIYSRTNNFVKLAFFGILCMIAGVIAMCGFSSIGAKAVLMLALVLATLPAEARLIVQTAKKNGVKMAHETSFETK